MEGNFEKKIRDKNSSKDYSRTTFETTDPRYAFGTKLKARMEEKGYTVETLKNEINKIIIKPVGDQAIRDWMQHYSIPETTDRMYAICKIFAPYSFEYFMDIVKDEPTHNLQYIYDNTGISSIEAIEHLKKISKKYNKETLDTVLKSKYLDTLIEGIERAQKQKYTVLTYEKTALSCIEDYIDKIYLTTIHDPVDEIPDPADEHPDEEITRFSVTTAYKYIDDLFNKIERLSDEEINNPFKGDRMDTVSIALDRETYKAYIQNAFNNLFKETVPDLQSFHYKEIMEIYERLIKPTKTFDTFTYEYYMEILKPLKDILKEYRKEGSRYDKDFAEGKASKDKTYQKNISALYEKAQKIIEESGNDKPIKPTKKKSQRKKV